MVPKPTRCQFQHRGFTILGAPVFRLTRDDRLPALALKLDENDVILPLSEVRKLFDIVPGSPDAEMLALVEQALLYVPVLHIGDELPPEVVTGEASWEPSESHRQIASARLQVQLVDWIGASSGGDGEVLTTKRLVASPDDPAVRARVQDALQSAARELNLQDGALAVGVLLQELATELSFVEALRERLHERVQKVLRRLARLGQGALMLSPARRETLFQVSRLAHVGAALIATRFDEVDSQTGEIIPALRNLDGQRNFLRPARDRLYAQLLDWEPLLKVWDGLPPSMAGEGVWRVVEDAYRFLAPRYMSVQEWQHVLAEGKLDKNRNAFVW